MDPASAAYGDRRSHRSNLYMGVLPASRCRSSVNGNAEPDHDDGFADELFDEAAGDAGRGDCAGLTPPTIPGQPRPGITGSACAGRPICSRRFRQRTRWWWSIRCGSRTWTGRANWLRIPRAAHLRKFRRSRAMAAGITTSANYPYSVQRYQPYRGGHAVPVPTPIGAAATVPTNPSPVDSRYGYSEQIVVPGQRFAACWARKGSIANPAATPPIYATQPIYHTLGWANEYEQGSLNSLAEPWDYFPFNDRDFTSVAELLLVPGCSPGLFTKQFVEFAPSLDDSSRTSSARSLRTPIPPTGGVAGTAANLANGNPPLVNGVPDSGPVTTTGGGGQAAAAAAAAVAAAVMVEAVGATAGTTIFSRTSRARRRLGILTTRPRPGRRPWLRCRARTRT